MKRLLTILAISMMYFGATAQPYNNSWINYGQQYFKFKVYKEGLHRIDYNALSSAFLNAGLNLNTIDPANLQLFYKGQEQHIYVKGGTDGIFHSSDYVEFYGLPNDGTLDTDIYMGGDSAQLHDRISMFNDTAFYFLTFNASTSNMRFVDTPNDTVAPPPKETYFMWDAIHYSDNSFENGKSVDLGQPLWDSEFDLGEGFVGARFQKKSPLTFNIETPAVYSSGPNAIMDVTTHCRKINSPYLYDMDIQVGGNSAIFYSDSAVDIIKNKGLNIPIAWLSSPTTPVDPLPTKGQQYMPWLKLTYPRMFDFDNETLIQYRLADHAKRYMEIDNFNDNGYSPVLYDLSNGLRIELPAGTSPLKVTVPLMTGSGDRQLLLAARGPSDITTVTYLDPRRYRDFSDPANQGDYVIITHPKLLPGGYVADYAFGRSAAGFDTITVSIDELYDQFIYGVEKHPLSVRNFAEYTLNEWTTKPEYFFIIGKGIEYWQWRFSGGQAFKAGLCLVPTWGHPGSDNLLTATDPNNPVVPQIKIGRLAAQTPDDVRIYYDKANAFQANLDDTTAFFGQGQPTIDDRLWQKRIIHFAGGQNASEQALFEFYLNKYEGIIEDSLFGGDVTLFKKSNADPFQDAQSDLLDSLINTGVSLITFFGHAAANIIEFNLTPEEFQNKDKYHFVVSNSCLLGQIHDANRNMSERYLLTEDVGGVGFMASVYLAVPSSLDKFTNQFYLNAGRNMYGASVGEINKTISQYFQDNFGAIYDKYLIQQNTLHGDPSLPIFPHAKPDYAIDAGEVSFDPEILSAKEDSFDVIIRVNNLGLAKYQEVDVTVTRTFPSGLQQPIQSVLDTSIYFRKNKEVKIVMDKGQALGLNKLHIKVDAREQIDELSEMNNEVTIEFLIVSDDVIPVYPHEYAIVDDMSSLQLKASTANSFADPTTYVIELDTTEEFNSPMKVSQTFTQRGGVVQWDNPPIAALNGTVYYWRASVDSTVSGAYSWNSSSFTYINSSLPGWNQEHYFQFLNDSYVDIELPSNRKFKFVDDLKDLNVIIGENTYVGAAYYINTIEQHHKRCFTAQWIVAILDSGTAIPQTGLDCNGIDRLAWEFYTNTPAERAAMKTFLDTIPNDFYVIVMGTQFSNASDWPGGEPLAGSIQALGGVSFDTTYPNEAPYMLFVKKGDISSVVEVTSQPDSTIDVNIPINGKWDQGSIETPLVGPASQWNRMLWGWSSSDPLPLETVDLDLIGVDTAGVETVLMSKITTLDTTLALVDANAYPFLKMRVNIVDDSFKTAAQLNYWRILYDPYPEVALNASLDWFFESDTLNPGEQMNIRMAVENIGDLPMDSMLVKFLLITAGGVSDTSYVRLKPLPTGDTLHVSYSTSTAAITYQGINSIIIEANPNGDQPEQYHFNNVGLKQFYVDQDVQNPILDVTFDGRHIMDGDIVSSKPYIVIRLNDENQYLGLDTNTVLEVTLIDPSNVWTPIPYDNNILRFTPADPAKLGSSNSALVEYRPDLTARDGVYKLWVRGRDVSGNTSGLDYMISFEIINKPMITHVLNYPNPFSTATRFVFTMTGADVPQFFKVQIMTITGRVVKEITQDEFGPIYIGPNISEYVWDGRDQYGDRLANGLYLYRVVTNLNGSEMDLFENESIDHMFKSGFGKMYLVK